MSREKDELLRMDSKGLVKELEEVNEDDKKVILASLRAMLIVADVNKKRKEKAKTA